MAKFIEFRQHTFFEKVDGYAIVNKHHGDTLGYIQWENDWHCWVAEFKANTILSDGCLADVQQFINSLPRMEGGNTTMSANNDFEKMATASMNVGSELVDFIKHAKAAGENNQDIVERIVDMVFNASDRTIKMSVELFDNHEQASRHQPQAAMGTHSATQRTAAANC